MTHPRMVWYEFSWIASVGMITFLIAAAFGSPVLMMAGAMMWGGFVLAARLVRRPVPVRSGSAVMASAHGLPLSGVEMQGGARGEGQVAFRSNTAG